MQDRDKQEERHLNKKQQTVYQAPEHSEEELDLRELLRKINRRRTAILGIFILVVAAAVLYLYQATPRYTAQTQLTLDVRKSQVVDVEQIMSGISPESAVISTEMDVIKSSRLLARVVDELELDRVPEFNPALREGGNPGLKSTLTGWLDGLGFLGLEEKEEEELSPEERQVKEKKRAVRILRNNLEVDHRRDSYTFTISLTSENPNRAARVANTLADLYLTDQLEAQYEATQRAHEWLDDRLRSLRQEVQAAEQAVKNVRQQSDMVQAGGSTILEQQIGDVNAQLIQARVKRSRAESRLARAEEIKEREGGIESLGEVIGSQTIQQLRSEESSLRRKIAELSQTYGERHPEMVQARAEMEDLQEKINEEASRIIASLENEVQSARAEERSLQQSLNELKRDAETTMVAELELRELERQAQSSRTLYQNFMDRFQETQEQEALQRPDARIISPAEEPDSPSHPRTQMTLGLSAVAGLMFGVMGAFLLETLDRGFRTGDQVEKATGLSMLGMIPLLGRTKGKPWDYVVKKPFSSLAESLRAIRTAIHLSNVDQPPKTIMVTSTLPREGKSTFSVSLGRLSANSGVKTLVIDADLRRPSLEDVMSEQEVQHRLEDVLQGNAGLKDAIVTDEHSGLHMLMSHGKAPSVAEMLGSQRMKNMLAELEEQYELILVDTPPVMGVSDTWTLARSVDSVVFIVRWAETPRETVRSALKQMELLDIKVGGVILSMVNVRQQSKYGYGGYGYYYGKYKKYYKE